MTDGPDFDPTRWVQDYGDALFAFAYARLRNRAEAEDCVQEAFVAALAARAAYRGEAGERAWLFGILRHKVVDCLRTRLRETPIESDAHADAIVAESFDHSGHWRLWPTRWPRPEEGVEQAQFRTALAACLENLPAGVQTAFRLSEVDGLASAEVCKVLGITATNLWVRLHRARLRLRECLERNWFHPLPGRRGAPEEAT